jgi:hypothetical protein
LTGDSLFFGVGDEDAFFFRSLPALTGVFFGVLLFPPAFFPARNNFSRKKKPVTFFFENYEF